MTDNLNPNFIFNLTSTALIVKAVNGEINLLDLACKELARRGLNSQGDWVGFKAAELEISRNKS